MRCTAPKRSGWGIGGDAVIDHISAMIPFKPITDDEPALVHSPMLKAALLTLGYIEANGPVGLTPLKALKRYFVVWADEAFDWPHYTAADLYHMNKVLNEPDFPPLVALHDVLLSAKLVRHHKGAMHITKQGKQLKAHPAVLWIVLAHHMLHVLDHSQFTRHGDHLAANWDRLLRVIDREAASGITQDQLCSVLFGANDNSDIHLTSIIYIHVLRPLCWLGLLEEQRQGRGFEQKRTFVKTPLWTAALPFQPALSRRS